MDHLKLDDIIEFVSLVELNDESKKLISKINTHIARCAECRALVRSFQTVHDELRREVAAADTADGWNTEGEIAAAFSLVDLGDGE